MVVSKQSRQDKQLSLRHLWLASLGTVIVARREARSTAANVAGEACKLRNQAVRLASDAQAIARGGYLTVSEQAESKLGQFSAEVEARLQPVLEKLGLKPKTRGGRRATRKPAARKTVRRSPRKSAKPAARKTQR